MYAFSLCMILSINSEHCQTSLTCLISLDVQIKLLIHVRRCNVHSPGPGPPKEEQVYELVELSGYFRNWVNPAETQEPCLSDDDDKISLKSCMSISNSQVIEKVG